MNSKVNAGVLLLVFTTAVLTGGANLLMRHGLVQAGGLHLSGDGASGVALRLARQWTFDAGLIGYVLSTIVWFKVLSIAEVSTTYPILVGFTFSLVTLGAVIWFRELITAVKIAGLVLILLGIVLIASGQRRAR